MLPGEVQVDCSYSVAHRPAHVSHPETGRLVCQICHPIGPKIQVRKSNNYGPQIPGSARRV